jgi:hypothetical protein
VRELQAHKDLTVGGTTPDPRSLVFSTRNGTPLRRSNFRRQVWRPALVRVGLLGQVAAVGDAWRATWISQSGTTQHRTFPTEREAIEYIARHAAERWVGTIRRELLDRILIIHRCHLKHVLADYMAHFNHHRPHVHCIKQRRSGRSHSLRRHPSYASDVTIGSVG